MMRLYNCSYLCRLIKKYYKTLIVVIAVAFCVMISYFIKNDYSDNTLKLNKGWDILYKDRLYKNQNITEFDFDMTKKGDIFTLEKTIKKQDLNLDDKLEYALRIFIPSCLVKVSYNGKKVYEKSDKETFYIGLPDNFINTRVKIEYEVLEDNAFANFNSLIVIDQNSYAKEVIGQNMEKLLISSIVFLYGSMVVLYCIYKWKKRLFIIRGILIGFFLMCLGGWIFSNNESYSILLGSNEHRIILKYYTIYFGSPILLLCLQNTLKSKNNKRIMLGLFFIQLAMAVVFTSINIVDNSYRSKFLLAIEVMAIFSIIVGRSMVCLDYSFFTNAEKKIISAFVVIGLSLVIEVIRYLLVYFNGYQYEIGNVFLMGVIMFGAGLVRAYMDYGYEMVKKDFFINKRYDKFNKDILTGLYDRQYFIDEMKEFDNKKNYTLLCFDLNGLKNVNLLYGYSNGDKYIELFAKKLEQYFANDFITISRISGDEFAMVSEVYMPKYIIKKKIKKMSVDLKKECKRELDVNVSFSYGYCVSKRRKIVKIKDAFTIANKMIMDNKRIKTAE